MDPILDDLNPEQRDAVQFGSGPLMVLAGAGSGKTRVITRRIARLLRDGVDPARILALTFTNKAAGEMQRRVEQLGGARVLVTTFHSACARFLRRDGERLGYPRDFSIYDTQDRDACLKMLMDERHLDRDGVKPAAVGRRISQLKNHGYGPHDAILGQSQVDAVVAKVFADYQELMRKLGALDFDDLIGRFLDLLREWPDVAESYQQRFPWLLVDEFQDTNRVQYEMLQRLVGGDRNLCVVGDPDQSIYRFRGAEVRNILDFQDDFPGTTVIRLERNYRSTRTILQAAEGVIANNLQRLDKRLITDNDAGDPIRVHRSTGPAQESRTIAREVDRLVAEGVSPTEIAVFYRSHYLSRGLEEGLRELAVPYRIVGGVSFFERREIKDLLAYVRVLINPLDDVSMERIVNVPPRGIGRATLDKLREAARHRGMSLCEAVLEPTARAVLAPRARNGLAALADALDAARDLAVASAHAPLREVATRIGYLAHIGDTGDPEDEARRENVGELFNDAAFFDQEIGGGLSAYLQHVALMTSQDEGDEAEERVSLMTIHAAKGLEFDHVFVAGLEEGLFPSSRSLEESGGLEEERRLMYVALTRARRTLWLGYSEQRMVMGRLQPQVASSFLAEVPRECVVGDVDARRIGFGDHWDDEYSAADDDDRDDGPDPFEFSQEPPALAPGLRVVHAVFGFGTVIGVQGRGYQTKVTVRFDRGGEKLLVAEHAGLKLVPGQEAS